MTNYLDDFERALSNVPEISSFKTALVEVVDTAYLARKWLEVYCPDYTAADVIAMTALVLAREREQGE